MARKELVAVSISMTREMLALVDEKAAGAYRSRSAEISYQLSRIYGLMSDDEDDE